MIENPRAVSVAEALAARKLLESDFFIPPPRCSAICLAFIIKGTNGSGYHTIVTNPSQSCCVLACPNGCCVWRLLQAVLSMKVT